MPGPSGISETSTLMGNREYDMPRSTFYYKAKL